MIFIASPYSHPEAEVRHLRFLSALRYANSLIARGRPAFSAIAYGHPFAVELEAPTNFHHWRDFNHHMIDVAREVHVLLLYGWEDSQGVADEIAYAMGNNRPVTYINVE